MAIGNQSNNQVAGDQQQPLAPVSSQDPYANQSDDSADSVQQQGPISVGSPESAPMPMASPESMNETPEYGYEAVKRIEQSPETMADAERKEASPQQRQQPQDQTQRQSIQKPVPAPAPKQAGPKVFGYSIPPALVNNFQAIAKKKTKGSAKDASTWVVMLLDRILKKQQGS